MAYALTILTAALGDAARDELVKPEDEDQKNKRRLTAVLVLDHGVGVGRRGAVGGHASSEASGIADAGDRRGDASGHIAVAREGAEQLGAAATAAGLRWVWIPVPDGQEPTAEAREVLAGSVAQLAGLVRG